VMEFFEQENIAVLPWLVNSPDLNPIEKVWAYIKRSLYRHLVALKDMDQFVQVICE
ncbi:hypothetical protein BGZ89_004953, partial [Linnemannia elongata]